MDAMKPWKKLKKQEKTPFFQNGAFWRLITPKCSEVNKILFLKVIAQYLNFPMVSWFDSISIEKFEKNWKNLICHKEKSTFRRARSSNKM